MLSLSSAAFCSENVAAHGIGIFRRAGNRQGTVDEHRIVGRFGAWRVRAWLLLAHLTGRCLLRLFLLLLLLRLGGGRLLLLRDRVACAQTPLPPVAPERENRSARGRVA